MLDNFWAETDNAILQCLRERGAMSPADLAHHLGISPGESAALVCMLATQGKVKVRLVELDENEASLALPRASARSGPVVRSDSRARSGRQALTGALTALRRSSQGPPSSGGKGASSGAEQYVG